MSLYCFLGLISYVKDPNMYMEVLKEYEKLDEIRKDKRQEELQSKYTSSLRVFTYVLV